MYHDIMDGGGEPDVGDGAPEADKPLVPLAPEPEAQAQAQEALVIAGVDQEPGAAEDGYDNEAVRDGRAELAEVDGLRVGGGGGR